MLVLGFPKLRSCQARLPGGRLSALTSSLIKPRKKAQTNASILNTKELMLEIRPSCEHCNKELPFNTTDAMICTFECTFCRDCVENILQHICPNCGGNFVSRPIRPKDLLEKYPVSNKRIYKPVDVETHLQRINNV